MRKIYIGDVHGCINELETLLKDLALTGKEQFVFLGDLVDKGPHSAKVVKRVRRLFNQYPGSVLIKGNHEEKHERFRRHQKKGEGRERTMKNYEELRDITEGLDRDDIGFLNSAQLFYRDEKYDVLAVHAGVAPSITWLPRDDDFKRMSRKKLKHFHQLLRVRYVNPKGYMVMLGAEQDEDKYWAEVYDGRYGTVLFGHQPFMEDEPKKYPHALGLDLGCVFGGKLAAYVYDGDDEYTVTTQGKRYAEPMFK